MGDTFQEILQNCEIARGTAVLNEMNLEYRSRQVYCTEAALRTIAVSVDLLLLEHSAKYLLPSAAIPCSPAIKNILLHAEWV